MSMHASPCKLAASRMKAMNCHEQEHQEFAAAAATTTTSNNGGGLDWLEDSISFLTADVDIGGWWSAPLPAAVQQDDDIGSVVAQTLSPPAAPVSCSSPLLPAQLHASPSIASPAVSSPSEPSCSKKRKSPPVHRSTSSNGNQRRRTEPGAGKKGGGGGGGRGTGAGSDNRDLRWAEQLLNPCAAAVEAGNLSRVQHLFYVLGELASFSGDANHRLAAHGLRALARRLLPATVGPAAAAAVRVPPACDECPAPAAFAGADPRLFRAALIRFHEVSPWFTLPNALANAAIVGRQAAAAAGAADPPRPLHVVDLGVSHGVQWPTLLESLTRLRGTAPPPSVRLTVVAPANASPAAPFSSAPPGYDFAPHLLRYARSIDLQLAIGHASSLDSVHGFATPGEALVVCLQFRLGHAAVDERTDVLKKVRGLNPDLVVLSELEAGAGAASTTAAGEFAARLELLWRFLESTAAAFKGRDSDERRLMEAEAGTSLVPDAAAAGEGKEAWRDRMMKAGFEEAAFGDEAVESTKSLLRKYDGGWEMSAPAPGAVALRWKGQPVSFCSLWRPTRS